MKCRSLYVLAVLVSALVASGCGIDVEMESLPSSVRAGEVVQTSGTLSVAMCPVSPAGLIFVPFVPVEALAEAPPALLEIIEEVCTTTGRVSLPGLGGNAVPPFVSKEDLDFFAAELVSASSASWASFTAADTITCPPMSECLVPYLLPGTPVEFRGAAITNRPGSYYNFVFGVGQRVDLCAGGMNQGEACETDDDCPGSTCEECGVGAQGFCTGGSNFLQPCNTNMDCPDSTCQSIGNDLSFGFDCTATLVTPGVPAPVASPWALASAVLALAALGWFGLRRLQS